MWADLRGIVTAALRSSSSNCTCLLQKQQQQQQQSCRSNDDITECIVSIRSITTANCVSWTYTDETHCAILKERAHKDYFRDKNGKDHKRNLLHGLDMTSKCSGYGMNFNTNRKSFRLLVGACRPLWKVWHRTTQCVAANWLKWNVSSISVLMNVVQSPLFIIFTPPPL